MTLEQVTKQKKDIRRQKNTQYQAEKRKKLRLLNPPKPRGSKKQVLTIEQLEIKKLKEKEYQKIYHKKWREKNKDKIKLYYEKKARTTKLNEWHSQWRKKNRHIKAAQTALRRTRKKNACPKWLTKEHKKQIQRIYKQSIELTKEKGVCYQVDHIIPLVSDFVCGLHVPWNLQIIPAKENLKKSNTITHLNYETV